MLKNTLFASVLGLLCWLTAAIAQTEQPQDATFAASYEEAAEARALLLADDYAAAAVLAAPLATAGNPVAQNLMGIVLENNGDPDVGPAVRMYELAMAQGYPKAFHNLALLYLEDRPTFPADHVKAVELYADAAAFGYAPSHEEWVWHLMWGDERVEDWEQAVIQGQIGVDAFPDNARLKELLADTHYFGMGQPKDFQAALALYEDAAALGSANGQFSAGYQYFSGEGTPVDDVVAREFFEKSVAQDFGYAYGFLAFMYYYGDGVDIDADVAFSYATQGDGRDDGLAAFIIAEAHADGKGAPQDYAIARVAYERSHAAGYSYALYRLGDMAYYGEGEPEDLSKAFDLFEQVVAEDPTEGDAVFSVGYMLMHGEGTQRDIARAVTVIEDAVALGNWWAMGEAILLYGGADYSGDHAGRVPTAAHCMHAIAEGFLAETDPQGEINTICLQTMGDLSDDERTQAKELANTL